MFPRFLGVPYAYTKSQVTDNQYGHEVKPVQIGSTLIVSKAQMNQSESPEEAS